MKWGEAMSRTAKDKKGHLKLTRSQHNELTTAYRRYKTEGPSVDEYYRCVERKGKPGILSDDWNWSEDTESYYEYLVNHENEAA